MVSGLHKIISETSVLFFDSACPYHICFTNFEFAYHTQVSMIESYVHKIDVSFAFSYGPEGSEQFGIFLS